MEYLEGDTLAARLSKGPLPLDQALRYGVEIADALDKAHRTGIVHRDPKPANVMLTKSGAKLLDFGLAKTAAPGTAAADASTLPTVSRAPRDLTVQGTILGTFQYMAPEQLEGQEADARTDIFAFGAVLYEMVTGRKAFEGKSQASLMAAILASEPAPMSQLQPVAPPALGRIVRKCLAKQPDERWQTAKDLHDELVWVASAGAQAEVIHETPSASPVVRSKFAAALVGMFIAGLGVAGTGVWFGTRADPPAVVRTEVTTPTEAAFDFDRAQRNIAITPDGTRVIYRGTDDAQRTALVVRGLGELTPRTRFRGERVEALARLGWSRT